MNCSQGIFQKFLAPVGFVLFPLEVFLCFIYMNLVDVELSLCFSQSSDGKGRILYCLCRLKTKKHAICKICFFCFIDFILIAQVMMYLKLLCPRQNRAEILSSKIGHFFSLHLQSLVYYL